MKGNVQAKALIQFLLKDGVPRTHTRTHRYPERKMDLPASCGLAEMSEPDRRRDATSPAPASATRREQKKRQRDASSPAPARCVQPSASEMRSAQRREMRSAQRQEMCSAQHQRDAFGPVPARCVQPSAKIERRTRTRAREDGRRLFVLCSLVVFSGAVAHAWPALIGRTTCYGSAFLQRTAPPTGRGITVSRAGFPLAERLGFAHASLIGRKMTHTLIWRQARTKRSVSSRTARTIHRAGIVVVVKKS